jgi:hypothetical protein
MTDTVKPVTAWAVVDNENKIDPLLVYGAEKSGIR